jgi:hypothetical protein
MRIIHHQLTCRDIVEIVLKMNETSKLIPIKDGGIPTCRFEDSLWKMQGTSRAFSTGLRTLDNTLAVWHMALAKSFPCLSRL